MFAKTGSGHTQGHCVLNVMSLLQVHLFCGIWGCIAVGLFTSPLNAQVGERNALHFCSISLSRREKRATTCQDRDKRKQQKTKTVACPKSLICPNQTQAAFGADTCGMFYACGNGLTQLYKQCVFVVAVFLWTSATMSIVILGAGWAGIPMAYDVETQVRSRT